MQHQSIFMALIFPFLNYVSSRHTELNAFLLLLETNTLSRIHNIHYWKHILTYIYGSG